MILLSALNAGLALTLVGLGALAWISEPASLEARPLGQWDPAESLSPKTPDAAQTTAAMTEAMARPLFQRNRRPFEPQAAAAVSPATTPAPVEMALPIPGVDVNQLTLKGLLLLPDRKRALIATADAPDGIWVESGSIVSGWTVKSLDRHGVVVAAGSAEAVLKLYVDNPLN